MSRPRRPTVSAPPPEAALPPATTLEVRLLWLPEAMPGTLFAAVDVLRAMQVLHQLRRPQAPPRLRWRVVNTAGRRLSLPWLPGASQRPFRQATQQLMVLPGLAVQDAPHLGELMARHAGALRLVQQHVARGGWLAVVFNGLVLPARLGLLDGHRLPAPWPYQSWLAREHPGCDFSGREPIGSAGRVLACVTPELATAMMLRAMAELLDPDLAQAGAQVLLHQPQRQQMAPALAREQWLVKTSDSPVQRATEWMQAHLEQPYALKDVAEATAASPRTLLRQFRLVTGRTPLQVLHGLRIDRAKLLLETTLHGLDAIATACGYADTASLRRLFRRETGVSMSAWRERHTLRARRPHWRVRQAR